MRYTQRAPRTTNTAKAQAAAVTYSLIVGAPIPGVQRCVSSLTIFTEAVLGTQTAPGSATCPQWLKSRATQPTVDAYADALLRRAKPTPPH